MNTEAMLRLADRIEIMEPEAFDMGVWLDRTAENICGSVGCIAGWAVVFDMRDRGLPTTIDKETFQNVSFSQQGRQLLGLTLDESECLFTADGWWSKVLKELGLIDEGADPSLDDITSKQAVIVLRALAKGEIDFEWDEDEESNEW